MSNFLKNTGFIQNIKNKQFIQILAVVVLLVGIGMGTLLIQQKTYFHSEASTFGDLAYLKQVSVSSDASASALLAVDGDDLTYWESSSSGEQNITVDLDQASDISQIRIIWGRNFAINYDLAGSLDNSSFTNIQTGLSGDQNLVVNVSARYLRLNIHSGNGPSYQLASLEVFPPGSSPPASLVVNDQSIAKFSQIPDNVLASAAATKIMFRHASVGGNINDGLNTLFTQNSKYNRSNWSFQSRGNPGWQPKVDDLVTQKALAILSMPAALKCPPSLE